VQILALWQPCFETANQKNRIFLLDQISPSASPTREIWERDYLAGVSCATALQKGTSLPQQSVTLVPSTPHAYKFTSLSFMKTNFFKKTVNVVGKSIVWNQICWFVFTFILKPHKTGDYQKFKVHFLFRFCERKSNNGRFLIIYNFFCDITGRDYGYIKLNAVLKGFEIFRVLWSHDRWRHNNKVVMDVTFMWSSIKQPKCTFLCLKLP